MSSLGHLPLAINPPNDLKSLSELLISHGLLSRPLNLTLTQDDDKYELDRVIASVWKLFEARAVGYTGIGLQDD
jgi:hypothetical protein